MVIADDVIEKICSDGAGITQPVHLHRTGPVRQDAGPGAFGMAFQVHRNVEFIGAKPFGSLPVGHAAHIAKIVESPDQPAADVAVILPAEGNCR